MTTPQQPIDSWDYLRTDSDDEDLAAHPDPEVAALHLDDGETGGIGDPGERDDSVEVEDGDDGPSAQYFADEEPEGAKAPGIDDHEPDLEEILEVQHYAFPPDDDGGD